MSDTQKMEFKRLSDKKLFIVYLIVYCFFSALNILFVVLFYDSVVHHGPFWKSALLISLALAERFSSSITFFPILFHSSAKLTFSSVGINCKMLGGGKKQLKWSEVRYAEKCSVLVFCTLTAVVREYYILSGHRLSENELKNVFYCAGGTNDIFVIPYEEKDVAVIQTWSAETTLNDNGTVSHADEDDLR